MNNDQKILKIDIVSDVVCPWCIIGYKRLEKALTILQKQTGDELTAEIAWHPYQLNPHIPEGGENLGEHLAKKYGISTQESIKARSNLTQIGKELGFQFDYYDDMKTYNTLTAHQLLQYAKETGGNKLMQAMKLRLFSAFFTERKAIDQIDVLVEEAVAVGLDGSESRKVLDDQRYAKTVQDEINHWRAMGVSSVPTYVFNDAQAVSGAHEPETLAQIILVYC